MSDQQPKSDNDKFVEQRLIEGMRSASDQAMSMSKWLIATLMATNSSGLFFSFKVNIELGKSAPLATYAFILGCVFAMGAGLTAYMNYIKAGSLYEELLYMTPTERWNYVEVDKKGRYLEWFNTVGIALGLSSMLSAAVGAYMIMQSS